MPKTADMKMKNKFLAFVIILAAAAGTFAHKGNLVSTSQSAGLQTLDGEIISLPMLKGKVVVLAVGASWLPLSKHQILTTNKLAKKYAKNDVVVYWVSADSANAKSKNFASDEQIKAYGLKNKLTAEILRDSDGLYMLKKYGVDQLPSFVILDKTGKSVGEPFGGLDPQNEPEIFGQIADAIDKLL
jgi:thiol-disulfide isomerase/thioredoxin